MTSISRVQQLHTHRQVKLLKVTKPAVCSPRGNVGVTAFLFIENATQFTQKYRCRSTPMRFNIAMFKDTNLQLHKENWTVDKIENVCTLKAELITQIQFPSPDSSILLLRQSK